MSERDESHRPSQLLHPVYLDVPMMISFLAALRGGVAFEDTTTRRESQTTTREREAAAKLRLPPLGALLGLDISGRMGKRDQGEASEEVQAVRQHTAASLFNALYDALEEEGLISRVAEASDLDAVSAGDVVELTGDFMGNPLETVVAAFRQALPYFELSDEEETQAAAQLQALAAQVEELGNEATELEERARKAGRSQNPAMKAEAAGLETKASALRHEQSKQEASANAVLSGLGDRREQEQGIRMLSQVGEDLATTPVQDTVIQSGDLQAILTMATEFFTDATRALLRAGEFRTVGKVTRILGSGDDVNLMRRTALGAAGPEVGRDLLKSAQEEGELQLETFDPIIKAPAIQVLPLAVFI